MSRAKTIFQYGKHKAQKFKLKKKFEKKNGEKTLKMKQKKAKNNKNERKKLILSKLFKLLTVINSNTHTLLD